ncbi:hypothetical protein Pla22_17470 [Rubripirellula amarantea]|uniref:Inner membrane protein YebE n=1 Tax=Rubripirellula amarantea TaxID=2527999 RepID=A0A5C5WW75_9BACT|nr:DUF533 domain-containing protein [Rubripirellula amarantea]TWT54112.1 hypothetical protein Pla22_17470 [Rubripirellula amarantea]
MDAMDILGALLGKKSGSGGLGGKILKDMMAGGRSTQQNQPQSRGTSKQSPTRGHSPQAQRPRTIGDAAKGLEDLLGVSNNHHQERRQNQSSATAPTRSGPTRSAPAQTIPQPRWTPPEKEAMDEQAKVLIRAMICAAKSDGQITQEEQDAIVKQLDHVSEEEISFLRSEFAKPVDVRDLAWSIPQGMEEQAYQISLIAIDLDEQKEAEYLADLAHGLRLSPQRCNEIHQQLGAPVIFR